MVDVVVIGAGIAGCAVARELMRHDLTVEVFEAGYDLACGASRTNSGIVHGGYDPEPGSAKARYNVAGARLIPSLAEELGFRYVANGSLVVALDEDDLPRVEELVDRGHANGVDHVRAISADELRSLEPNVNPAALGALLCESSGICDPFGMTVAFAENAAANGARFHFESPVEGVRHADDGQGWLVSVSGRDVHARCVVNAAGVGAMAIHDQVSADKIASRPRAGEYVLLSRDMGTTFSHTMFRVPGPAGKGVLVSPTVEGNLIVGPDAQDRTCASDTWTTPEGLAWVVDKAHDLWPGYDRRQVIVNFCGVRPSGDDGDFVIGEPDDAPGFYDIAAFDSPGLTSAPAVAADIASRVADRLGAAPNPTFDGHRERPLRFIEMDEAERTAAIAADPLFAHIVCRCEQVSEAEVLAAIHAPIPATTVTGVKRRCRAGTGKCQGGFCEPLVAEIISRECGIPLEDVRLEGPGSEVAPWAIGEVR
ncbi:MAG: NAD(P)/FAD-dependent oxidoreductase [Atopobiaceae bacterium]|nr:NAD(P)/FAD-dependent oxidoreductase [Atopobiaceae bacterium]MCI2172845.1 NAD(P)/FAD-dependent oxidoreductase [Atopobiaceae bacterium]MCI2207152.1 NAD(P)/FAD-dependent oxidoreductase [Atopobiaceae bacterium]